MKTAWKKFEPRLGTGRVQQVARFLGIFPLREIDTGLKNSAAGFVASLAAQLVSLSNLLLTAVDGRGPAGCGGGVGQHFHLLALLVPACLSSVLITAFIRALWHRQALSAFHQASAHLEFCLFMKGVVVEDVGWLRRWLSLVSGILLLSILEMWSGADCGGTVWRVKSLSRLSLICLVALDSTLAASSLLSVASLLTGLLSGLRGGLLQPQLAVRLAHRILELVNLLMSAYSVSLLVLFFSSLAVGTTNAYLGVTRLEEGESWRALGGFLWALLHLALAMSVIQSAERIRERAFEFDTELYHQFINGQNRDLSSLMTSNKMILHISCRESIHLRIGGFVELDWHLATSMVAASSTYIIIIIQVLRLYD